MFLDALWVNVLRWRRKERDDKSLLQTARRIKGIACRLGARSASPALVLCEPRALMVAHRVLVSGHMNMPCKLTSIFNSDGPLPIAMIMVGDSDGSDGRDVLTMVVDKSSSEPLTLSRKRNALPCASAIRKQEMVANSTLL